MAEGTVRALNMVSDAEMDRRWRRIREAMAERGLDALVLQNSSDWVGGYVRWFTNQPATNGYPKSVVFPREEPMTVVEQGPVGGLRVSAADARGRDGIGRVLTTPSYPSVHYTACYDADLVVAELRRLGAKTLGVVAPAAMYHGFGRRIGESLADLDVVDATDWVDRLKAQKSDEERSLIRRVAAMQDEVMARVGTFIRPGLRDFEVAAYAQYVGQQLGSEQGIFLCSSAPPGQAAAFRPRSMQGRRLEAGDVFSLLIENNGAGGFYTELSRIFVLGRTPAPLRDAHAAVLDAQRYALTLLKPGAACRDVHRAHNAYLRERGLPEERRLNMHGMGYDMVERPLIRDDEDMAIEAHMAIVCHPGVESDGLFVHNTDVYLIEANGVSPCLHATPKQIFER